MMADASKANIAEETESLRRYWSQIDADPEVAKRREAIEKARKEKRPLPGAVYPSEYLADRDL